MRNLIALKNGAESKRAKRFIALAVAFVVTIAVGCEETSTVTETESLDGRDAVTSQGRPDDAPAPVFGVQVWGNDQEWEALAPKEPVPADEQSHAPWIVMGAVDADDPQAPFFFGDHDHVMSVPKDNRGTFSGVWHLVFVVPADGVDAVEGEIGTEADLLVRDPPLPDGGLFDPGPLAYAADLDGDGEVEPGEELTSLAKVEKAEELGLVEIEDQWANEFGEPFIFICPVRPL